MKYLIQSPTCPSADAWIAEAKADPSADRIGMYLTHTGIVRTTAKAKVRNDDPNTKPVTGMQFSYDAEKVESAISDALQLPGIYHIRVWLAEGRLAPGDTIMQVLVGGDIRPHVIDCLQQLVGFIKSNCVSEEELYS